MTSVPLSERPSDRAARAVADALPAAGSIVADKYAVIGLLGVGGMGGVLLAKDTRLGRQVAVKVVLPHLLDVDNKEASRERFLHEAQAMAAVRHENVVPIFDFGEHEGTPFIVMDYVDGESLAQRITRSRTPVSVDEGVAIMSAVCSGVAAIHAAGIVHGDLKPSNVLLDRAHRAYVTDFGVTLDASTAATSEGTPGYLAPERLGDEPPPKEERFVGDVYSLGVMAFEVLSGRRPFEAPDAARVLVQQLYKAPPLLSSLRPDLSVDFDDVVGQAMARDPRERTATAEDFGVALKGALARAPRRQPRRLLLVDDDPAFLALVQAIVEEELPAVTIDAVTTGEEGLACATNQSYDAIAVDLHLPDVNGLELTALLAERHSADTSVLVITGTGAARDWQVLSRMGATDFLLKPVDPRGLVASLERALYEGS